MSIFGFVGSALRATCALLLTVFAQSALSANVTIQDLIDNPIEWTVLGVGNPFTDVTSATSYVGIGTFGSGDYRFIGGLGLLMPLNNIPTSPAAAVIPSLDVFFDFIFDGVTERFALDIQYSDLANLALSSQDGAGASFGYNPSALTYDITAGMGWRLEYLGSATAVPEPPVTALLGSAIAAMLAASNRRKYAKALSKNRRPAT